VSDSVDVLMIDSLGSGLGGYWGRILGLSGRLDIWALRVHQLMGLVLELLLELELELGLVDRKCAWDIGVVGGEMKMRQGKEDDRTEHRHWEVG